MTVAREENQSGGSPGGLPGGVLPAIFLRSGELTYRVMAPSSDSPRSSRPTRRLTRRSVQVDFAKGSVPRYAQAAEPTAVSRAFISRPITFVIIHKSQPIPTSLREMLFLLANPMEMEKSWTRDPPSLSLFLSLFALIVCIYSGTRN